MQNIYQISQEIMAKRGLIFHKIHEQYSIDGSPERCLSRHVVEDNNGRLWLMEHLADGQRHSRNAIAKILASIAPYCNGVPVPRALLHEQEEHQYIENSGDAWQISPFYIGVPLPRPAYLQEGWRGVALGTFFKQLYTASTHLERIPPPHIHINKANSANQHSSAHYNDPTNIEHYIAYIADKVRKHPQIVSNAQSLQKFERVIEYLDQNLPLTISAQRNTLAHGDLHPLNCIWQKDHLVGVIDWEFCGARPILYDMANCLGCCGFEHPSGLVGKFAKGLLRTTLLPTGFITQDEARLLPTMVMALRFAWLSEWCKKRDYDMLAMELEYLQILLYNHDLLSQQWSTS